MPDPTTPLRHLSLQSTEELSMTSNALYFPYIDVPDNGWMARSILYWDGVASIVPSDYLHDPREMSTTMRRLLGDELVIPVVPAHHLWQVPDFAKSFVETLERKRRTRHAWTIADSSKWTLIHAEKLQNIARHLEGVGLARRTSDDWMEVEPLVAKQFMAYLASVLGRMEGIDAAPITDDPQSAAALNTARHQSLARFDDRAGAAREGLLEILLPTPAGSLDVDRLRRFKNKHGHQLTSLRVEIEDHCGTIADLPTEEARARAADRTARQLQRRVADVEDEMRVSFGRITFGSILPIAAGGLALADAANPVGMGSALISFAVAAQQAIASVGEPRKVAAKNPLAYLVRARRVLSSR